MSERRTRDEVAHATRDAERTMSPQRLPVNMWEAPEALVVVAPLPAVTPEDTHVELRPGAPATLRIWAHVRSAPPRDFLIKEWEYGGYEREIELPEGFGSGLEASLANGQLAVRVLRGAPTGPVSIHPTSPGHHHPDGA